MTDNAVTFSIQEQFERCEHGPFDDGGYPLDNLTHAQALACERESEPVPDTDRKNPNGYNGTAVGLFGC